MIDKDKIYTNEELSECQNGNSVPLLSDSKVDLIITAWLLLFET